MVFVLFVYSVAQFDIFFFMLHHSSHDCQIAKHFTIIFVIKTDVFVWLISDVVF